MKFEDVERIIRDSDFEDRRPESSRDGRTAQRVPRREGIFAASADSINVRAFSAVVRSGSLGCRFGD